MSPKFAQIACARSLHRGGFVRRVLFGLGLIGCSAGVEPVPYVERPLPDTRSPAPPGVELRLPERAQKICQLIGDVDLENNQPVINRTASRAGLLGTDLGISIRWGGDVVFLFGDSWAADSLSRPNAADAFATLDAQLSPREACDRMKFATASDHGFDPITLDGHTLPGFQVPTGGFAGHHHLFVFFTVADETGHTIGTHGGRGVLARSNGDNHFETVRRVSASNERFNMIAATLGPSNLPGLPSDWHDRESVLLYGTGHYRRSFPRLAVMQRNHPTEAFVYYAGEDAEGSPMWSHTEESAMPLFPDRAKDECVGEMSVAWAPHLERWLMTYNCGGRILARSAVQPWGPWSAPLTIFDRAKDGWGIFIHHPCGRDSSPCGDQDFSPELGDGVSGGVYGPYLVPEWFSSRQPGEEDIVFTMSTWNPYVSVLMHATLSLP